MKVYISVDSEGISGVAKGGYDPAKRIRWMTEDANAAVAGAFDGGATDVLVKDACGAAMSIDAELLDERARLLSGWKAEMCMMDELDDSFDAAMLVGYHSRVHTEGGVLCHSFSGDPDEVRINGRPVGEAGLNAAVAGHYGVPVVMVAGDEAAVAEARDLLGEVETAAVKRGLARDAALLVPLKEARRMIREAAKRAISNVSRFSPLALDRPIRLEIAFRTVAMADLAALVPGVQKTAPREISVTAGDPLEMWRLFRVLTALAGSGH